MSRATWHHATAERATAVVGRAVVADADVGAHEAGDAALLARPGGVVGAEELVLVDEVDDEVVDLGAGQALAHDVRGADMGARVRLPHSEETWSSGCHHRYWPESGAKRNHHSNIGPAQNGMSVRAATSSVPAVQAGDAHLERERLRDRARGGPLRTGSIRSSPSDQGSMRRLRESVTPPMAIAAKQPSSTTSSSLNTSRNSA